MTMEHNNEEYPRLTPPTVVYEGKAALKKPAIIPLWVKVSAAAASVALLVALFWNHPSRPELELMAELSPVKAVGMEMDQPLCMTGQRAHYSEFIHSTKKNNPGVKTVVPIVSEEPKRTDLAILASMPSRPIALLPVVMDDPALMLDNHLMLDNPLLLDDPMGELAMDETESEEDELSLAKKGFQKMTDGRFDSFGELLEYGWRSVKGELAQFNESVSNGISSIKDYNSANY